MATSASRKARSTYSPQAVDAFDAAHGEPDPAGGPEDDRERSPSTPGRILTPAWLMHPALASAWASAAPHRSRSVRAYIGPVRRAALTISRHSPKHHQRRLAELTSRGGIARRRALAGAHAGSDPILERAGRGPHHANAPSR